MNNNLKRIRKEAGLTLQELGDMCGSCKSYMHELEKDSKNPSLKIAYSVAGVLGKSVYQIWPDTTEIIEETITIRRVVTSREEGEQV